MSLATVTDGVADALVTVLDGVDADITAYKYDPAMAGVSFPAVLVFPPELAPGDELLPNQLGAFGWYVTYAVAVVYDMSGYAGSVQSAALQYVSAAIPAIVKSNALNLLLEDEPTVSSVEWEFVQDAERPRFEYHMTVTCPVLIAF